MPTFQSRSPFSTYSSLTPLYLPAEPVEVRLLPSPPCFADAADISPDVSAARLSRSRHAHFYAVIFAASSPFFIFAIIH